MIIDNSICDQFSLYPSHHGEECAYNGDNPRFECCCDEYGHYLTCYPDWKDSVHYLFINNTTPLLAV